MKRNLLLSFFLLSMRLAFGQGICNEAGNIIIFANYDGGELNINIDENIPDIQIGICTYESIDVNISGTYASNVTKVTYAGYDGAGTTNVTGVDAGIVDILIYPPATLDDPDGNVYMVCAYECDTAYVPGGCNTVDQLADYFLTNLDGSLRFTYMHYEIFGTGTYYISDGGNCCVGAPACILAVDAGANVSVCPGEGTALTASGADDYEWSPSVSCDPPCETVFVSPDVTTTYIVTGTDDEGCFGVDSVTVTIAPLPVATISQSGDTLYAGGGSTYMWLQDGVVIPGAVNYYYVPEEDGSYQAVAVSSVGCKDTTDILDVVVQGIGMANIFTGVSLSPNPASSTCMITMQSNLNGKLTCSLISSDGSLVYKTSFDKNNPGEQFSIDLSTVSSGIYTLSITSEKFAVSRKLIVLKN